MTAERPPSTGARGRGLLLSFVFLATLVAGVRAGEDALFTALEVARGQGDAKRVRAALEALVEAHRGSTDPERRRLIVDKFAEVAEGEDTEAIRIEAARALGRLADRLAAWKRLKYMLPWPGETVGPFEVAVARAVADLAYEGSVPKLLELAAEADDVRIAAEALRGLGAVGEGPAVREKVLAGLMELAERSREGAAPASGPAASGPADAKAAARWKVLAPPLVRALVRVTGRRLDLAAFLALWRECGQRPAEVFPPPPGFLAPLGEPDSEACLRAVDALFDRGLSHRELTPALEGVVAESGDWRTVSMALRALAAAEIRRAPPSDLLRMRRHKRWQVRLALAEALAAYQDVESADTLIRLLGDKQVRVRLAAARSLGLLTGQGFGVSQRRWAAWRRKEGKHIRFVPRSARPKEAQGGHEYAFETASPPFFGTRIHSDRVVLVLDKSESMYYGLFDQVVEEVQAFLLAALPTTTFGVIEFDEKARLWQSRLAPAGAANVEKVVAFLRKAKPYGPTNIIDSLRRALTMPGVDTVVLLSDGLPNRGDPHEPEAILAEIRRLNRYERTAIHTLQMMRGRLFPHDGPRGEDKPPPDAEENARRAAVRRLAPDTPIGGFLESLASQNDGTYDVVFADSYRPPPDATFRKGTDE
ncbi:MAG: HEAT repeat domain-containing protein [Planctomycetota bacterium]